MELTNTFESGQPDGTAMSAANTGGAAGDAFDSVTAGSGAAAAFSSTALDGSLSGHFTTGATNTFSRAIWGAALGGTFSHLYLRAEIQPDNLTPAQLAFCRFQAAGSQACRLTINSDGTVSLRNRSSATVVQSTGTITTSDTWLVRADITFGSSGAGTLYIHYDPANVTPDETLPFSSADLLNTSIDEVDWGIAASATNAGVKLDRLVISSVALPPVPVLSGSASLSFGGLDLEAVGHVTAFGSADLTFGGLDLTAAGTAVTPVEGSAAFDFGGLDLTAAGMVGSSSIDGQAHFTFGGLSLSAVHPPPVEGAAHFSFGKLTISAHAQVVARQFLFTPPQFVQTTVIRGSLRYSYPVSETVWKDADGVWQHSLTAVMDEMVGAQVLLSVGGRPELVSEEIANELIAAGIGTITET